MDANQFSPRVRNKILQRPVAELPSSHRAASQVTGYLPFHSCPTGTHEPSRCAGQRLNESSKLDGFPRTSTVPIVFRLPSGAPHERRAFGRPANLAPQAHDKAPPFAIAPSLSIAANAATLSLLGNSTTVCQLIGETIWDTGTPGTATAAKTLSNFGLGGVDLGFPVDSGSGPLYFLFGDGVPPGHPPNSLPTVPPDDALGYTSRTTPPDSVTCLDLQLATSAPKKFAHPMVAPTIQQGSFNVPTSGVFSTTRSMPSSGPTIA